jgi:hypothetical protein
VEQYVFEAENAIDVLLIAAPIVGLLLNLAAQLVLVRLAPQASLLRAIVLAFLLGAVGTVLIAVAALRLTRPDLLDAAALFAAVMIIYGAEGLVLFAIVNLGETSLRIRMLAALIDAPDGLSETELTKCYEAEALIAIRLKRLRTRNQVGFGDGVLRARRSFLFFAANGVALLQALIFGRRT